MHFSTTTILSITSLLLTTPTAFALPSPRPVWQPFTKAIVDPSPSSPFTLTATRQNSPIDGKPINAQQHAFYIGNTTKSYCPTAKSPACPTAYCPHRAKAACPVGNKTAMYTTAKGRAHLDVQVPHGQTVFVNDTDGALQYTVAYANVIPKGATAESFALFRGGQHSSLTFSGVGKASGFLACPVNATVYKVYADLPRLEDANVPLGNLSACVGFDAEAASFKGYAAWQYE